MTKEIYKVLDGTVTAGDAVYIFTPNGIESGEVLGKDMENKNKFGENEIIYLSFDDFCIDSARPRMIIKHTKHAEELQELLDSGSDEELTAWFYKVDKKK